ncbi:PAS domain-containing protein [Phocea massiliensis]|uniref:PAS domain-containing protein n=1 Tax=Merdimmobilis hominis TaxID=2897707 RepID=UPI001E5B17AE|nr:PAS domain-containing protein [Merdimmobilis hominis]MCD4837145.1 PAS domain-containing protein [Merdimmobilis hominis]
MMGKMPLPKLTAEQVVIVLDNAPVAVYVSAVDTLELLYANQLAKQLFPRSADTSGLTCYQAAGFDRPCPFCHVKDLTETKLLAREFHHPDNGRIYQLSGKIIRWGDVDAHIEYFVDITDKKREENRSKLISEELQATFSNIPCGLCVYRYAGGNISPLFHNPAFYEIMGYSDEHIDAVERSTSFLGVHPEDLPRLRELIQRILVTGGTMGHTYRLWNDKRGEYRWIHLDSSVKTQADDSRLLYGVYSDVSEQRHLEGELVYANEKMQDIVNAIPGGVAIYKMTNIFETKYFSDGLAEMTGYSVEEYQELAKRDAAELVYWEDTSKVVAKALKVIATHEVAKMEFRQQHRDGQVVWVRAQIKWIGEEGGCPLLHCVFHNISDLKEAQLEMDHLINSIPGGIASYRIEGERFIPTFYSDGVVALSGHTREEFQEIVQQDALDVIYGPDRDRVMAQTKAAVLSGEVLDISYRMRHKNGSLIWIHLNGRRMGPLSDSTRFYAVFTGMSAEARLFQSIANETADGIYVISRDTYDLLYLNESKNFFARGENVLGQKCYTALHGMSGPCPFCTLKDRPADGQEYMMQIDGADRFYTTWCRESDWNGIPAYVKYVRDVTEEVKTRKEKERLEQYFQTVVKNLPGGIGVIRYEEDGKMTPEFLSDGFAAMTGMTLEGAWQLYEKDAMAGVYPGDVAAVKRQVRDYIASGDSHRELNYRLKTGDGAYIWIKNTISLIENEGGERRLYTVYRDVTKEREEQENIRRQYNELILQHYRTPGPNALVVGHCNISQSRILEIIDYTDSGLLDMFGTVREDFFTGLSTLIVDEGERQKFRSIYLDAPARAAFERNETERIMECFVQFPKEDKGRYVQVEMNMVSTPDTGDITGILTVTDTTERTISNRILHQLLVTGFDFVVDVDLTKDTYSILSSGDNPCFMPPVQGCYSQWMEHMAESRVVPRDREAYRRGLAPGYLRQRLEQQGSYTFTFSLLDDNGDIRTKNMTVSAVDLRLGRVCLSRTDITESMREQQGLLRMIAYTFELAGFIDIGTRHLTLYARNTVLENLSPYLVSQYDQAVEGFVSQYGAPEGQEEARNQFQIETMLQRLQEKPSGYDFPFPYRGEEGERFKQVTVLWGDSNHQTICMVRADVTDMLAAERQSKKELESALALAEEANQAKSDFLSAMSHDIRTPMNAIMGMTALAVAHMGDRDRVADCLQKISISSKHLLSLINDVLDMSKIERSKITLNQMRISLPQLMEQLSAIMAPQARAAGLEFSIHNGEVQHPCFYGDSLRISQILINLLSNAVKFTQEGGRVAFLAEELPPSEEGKARYRFTVNDTGMGMPEEFLARIFDPFSRSRAAARMEGTGLGLSITKGLVDLMGGQIAVESQVNQGTTFRVELEGEIAPQEEAPAEEAQSRSPSSDRLFFGRRFLVAEDNAINAEILCELLQMYGAETVVKTDGTQAVREFQTAAPRNYDAILMDIQMPQMNGYEATRIIREMERPDAKDIPIVAMTANAFSEDVQASLAAGMTAHVAKPLDVDVLRDTLDKVLGRPNVQRG